MNLQVRRRVFWIMLTFLTLYPVFVVVSNTSIGRGGFIVYVSIIQRALGLIAFSFLFVMIALGSAIDYFVKLLGGKTYTIHKYLGIFTYVIVLGHPLMYTVLLTPSQGFIGAFMELLPSMPENSYDNGLALGRIALLFLTFAIIASYFRTRPFWRKHWRKLHILNYAAFYFVAVHAFTVGSDVRTPSYLWMYYLLVSGVTFILAKRIFIYLSERVIRKNTLSNNSKA